MSRTTSRSTTNRDAPDGVSLVEERVRAAQELGPGPVHKHPARRVNCHGVFREVDLHLRMTGDNTARTRAEIRVIEDIHGWYVATGWTLEKGQYRGSTAPLSIYDQGYPSRTDALEEGKKRIIEATRSAAKDDHKSVEKAKREAAEVHTWVRKAVKQPDWFDRMTPDEHRLKDEGESNEDSGEEPAAEQSGTQESLF